MNRFRRRGGMPAVGNIEYVVKPPHQRHLPVQNPMGINPEQFFGQQDFDCAPLYGPKNAEQIDEAMKAFEITFCKADYEL